MVFLWFSTIKPPLNGRPDGALCSHRFLRRSVETVPRSAMANENAVQVVEEKQDLGWLSRSPLDLHIQYGIYI